MYLQDRAGTLASLLNKAEKPSVCPSVCIFGMVMTQQPLHGVKWDLLKMKTVSLRMKEFIFITHCSLTGLRKRRRCKQPSTHKAPLLLLLLAQVTYNQVQAL